MAARPAVAKIVIIDLEDAVAAPDKPAARQALLAARLDHERTIIRINSVDTADARLDLETLTRTDYRILMVPKCESAEQLERVEGYALVALLESPRGILHAENIIIAVPSVVAVMWGAKDLVATLGGNSSRLSKGQYRAVVTRPFPCTAGSRDTWTRRSRLGLHEHPRRAWPGRRIGRCCGCRVYGQSCHSPEPSPYNPDSIRADRRTFEPTEEEVAWALRVLAAANETRGVFQFEGQMVDSPVLRHAERVLSRRTPALRG